MNNFSIFDIFLGSGKSSLVNLLLGQNRADVSDKAVGCTFNFQKYETPNFNLYDTVGLSEGGMHE